MIEILKKYPIVEAACSKVGISRSTHYEWINRDERYSEKVNQALSLSVDIVSDIAENNIISAVKRGDHKASTFWLRHHKPEYKPPARTYMRVNDDEFGIDLVAEARARTGAVPTEPRNTSRIRSAKGPRLSGIARKLAAKYADGDDDED